MPEIPYMALRHILWYNFCGCTKNQFEEVTL